MRKLHRNLSVIETRDEKALQETLLALRKRGVLVRPLSPTLAALAPEGLEDALRILKDLGQLPRVVQ